MKVLVVDDESSLRLLVIRRLAQLGHEAVEAEDGQAAWEFFQREHFPMVITDWMMPRLTGLDLIRNIRSTNRPDYTYIIVVTILNEWRFALEAQQAGADDYLTKPIDATDFLTRVTLGERFLRVRAQLREAQRQAGKSSTPPG